MSYQCSLYIPLTDPLRPYDEEKTDILLTEVFQGLFEAIVPPDELTSGVCGAQPFASLVSFLSGQDRRIPGDWIPASATGKTSTAVTPLAVPLVSGTDEDEQLHDLLCRAAPEALPEAQRAIIVAQIATILLSGTGRLSVDIRCFLPHDVDLSNVNAVIDAVATSLDTADTFAYSFYNALVPMVATFMPFRVVSHTRAKSDESLYSATLTTDGDEGPLWFIANASREAGTAEIPAVCVLPQGDDKPALFRDLCTDDILLPHREDNGALSLELQAYETVLLRPEVT
ncbi:MAG: hypothetical protein EA383_14910 [Spirochaetaceae bacterium]|nr:MAG: hypothetical protein EA383_14910 [Spirochaetaceae bacterium]